MPKGPGIHIVAKRKAGQPTRWYVYAWRGGPQIATATGAKPKLTAALQDEAKAAMGALPANILRGLVAAYRAPTNPEWTRLADSTRATWRLWLDRIVEEFGDTPIGAFEDRRMREYILEWRDRWAHQPRSADMAMQVFSRLLSWAHGRGKLDNIILDEVESLYEVDRSDIIWEAEHFAAFDAVASVQLREAIELAACTGLRRSDLVAIPWEAVGANAILWKTGKSRGRRRITVPLIPETRALLERIKARHAEEMARRRPNRRKPLPATILANSWWEPWTPSGLGSSFHTTRAKAGITVHLHDLRGTFATRCMLARLTDQEIADILGWSWKDVAHIRAKYVDQARVVVAIGERIAAQTVNQL